MATKRNCSDSRDLREGHANLKSSKTGSGRATRNLFSPRRLIGRNDMVVDLNLGKVVIPKEEVVGVVKEEKTSEELENASVRTSALEDAEGDVQVKLVEEEVDILDNFEAATLLTCSCACWNKIESLEAVVEEQGRLIQNLDNVVLGLLGKQVASEEVQRTPGKESVVVPVLGKGQPTQSGEIDSGKDTGKRGPVHQRQPEVPSAEIPVISVTQLKKEGAASSSNARKKSSRPLPSHPNGISRKQTKDGVPTKVKENSGASGEKHTCPQCSKEGRHRIFSSNRNLRRHVQEIHSLQKKLHKCDTCSKTFSRKELLDRHFKMVHEGVRYQCTHCTGSYVERPRLVEHEKTHSRGIPLIRCKVCGLDLISQSDESLKRHLCRCHGGGMGARKKRPKQTAKAPPPLKKVCVERLTRDCSRCEKRFDCDASLRYHLHKMHGILQAGEGTSLSDGVNCQSQD